MSEERLNTDVYLEILNEHNWLQICDLSVSLEQKEFFPIPNVYWIGISRYEEHTELFAIKYKDEYIGLIGAGYDGDGVSGFINPFMIDEKHQKKGYALSAIRLITEYLIDNLHVIKINISHRKVNVVAGQIYERLGFVIKGEDEINYLRCLEI